MKNLLIVAFVLTLTMVTGRAAAQTVLPRAGWVATASTSNGGEPASKAIDGNPSSRWSTGTDQTSGQWFSIDMIAPQTFSQVTLDPTGSSNDWTRAYQVFVSDDAVAWGAPVASGTGSAGVLTIIFPTQTARFIGIVQTGSGSNWWSIGEVNVYGPGAAPTVALSPAGWIATASSSGGSDVPARAVDGSLSSRWTTGSPQVNGQWFQLDMLQPRALAKLTMNSDGASSDYPRGYQVFISNDTASWGSPVSTGTGTSSVITVTFPQKTGRYLRIVQTRSATNWWSIAELTAFGVAPFTAVATVLPRTGWTAAASSSCGTDVPDNALDDNSSTRWNSGLNQANGQFFQIDMKASMTFTKITLDAGASVGDYPRAFSVFATNDTSSWGTAFATGTGSGQVVTIEFPARTARHLKIVQTGSSSTKWWSIHELNVYGTAPFQLIREGWIGSASASSTSAKNALDGNLSTRWSTGAPQVNGQWFQLDMLAPQTFDQITLNAAGFTSDYPRGYQVFATNDPSNWGTPVASGAASAPMVAIAFNPRTARFIRIVQTGSSSSWWSIAEVLVYSHGFFYGVPRVDLAAAPCADGTLPIGCRAFDCTTGGDRGEWLAAPACTGSYASCPQACPSVGTPLSPISPARSGQVVRCNCACGDPISGAPDFSVSISACADPQAVNPCNAICRDGGDPCGSAEACSVSSCSSGTLAAVVSTQSCDPTDGSQVRISSVADWGATVIPGESEMVVTIGGVATHVALSGDLGFNLGADSLDLSALYLNGAAFSFFGRSVTSAKMTLIGASRPAFFQPVAGDPEFAPRVFSFEPGRLNVLVEGVVDGQRTTMQAVNLDSISGQLSQDQGRVTLTGHAAPALGTSVDLHIAANVLKRPPLAVLNAPSLVECTANRSASVTLDGLGSMTFDESPIVRYQWFVERNSAASSLAPLGSGLTLTTRLPVGTNVVGLNVYDNVAASGRATRSIVVRDTVAPVINSPGNVVTYVGSATSGMVNLGWAAVTDQCDPRPTITATLVSLNGATVNQPVADPAHFSLPLGDHVVRWSALDVGANLASILQFISVRPGVGQVQSALGAADPACPQPAPSGTTPVTVDLHVCVFGRKNLTTGAREGTPVWANCNDDACVNANIATLMADANSTWADTVHFNVVGFRVIRDNILPKQNTEGPCMNHGDQHDQYGDLCLNNDLHLPTEASQAVKDCDAAWGFQPYSLTDDGCSRGLVLVLAGMASNGGGQKCGYGDVGSANANQPTPSGGPSPVCADPTLVSSNDLGAYAVVLTSWNLCQYPERTISHELGHALGLFHGDGIDEDCNGVWDDVCDPMEFASMETGPLTLMSNEVVVPATLTNLQKNRARAFASKTLPNITPRVCAAPPPPPPPEDIGSPPQQPQPAQGCGCYVSGSLEHSAASIVVFVLALAWTRRRRGGAKATHDVL